MDYWVGEHIVSRHSHCVACGFGGRGEDGEHLISEIFHVWNDAAFGSRSWWKMVLCFDLSRPSSICFLTSAI